MRHIRSGCASVVLAASWLLFAVPSAQAQPCAMNLKSVVVCGQGDEALTILAHTRSPSGRIAVGWRMKKGVPRTNPLDGTNTEEHIVRLADGKVLGAAIGRAWNDGEMESNKIDLVAVWSPDERWLLLADVGQEFLVDLAVYRVDAEQGTIREVRLLEALKAVAHPKLKARVGRKSFEEYELQLPYKAAIRLTNAGAVTLPFDFRIPKQSARHDVVARFAVTEKQGRVTVSPIDAQFKKR